MRGTARSPEAYDRFSSSVDGPMTALTVLWLPVLLVPFAVTLHGSISEACSAIDYTSGRSSSWSTSPS